jgi:hypothetical protein
MVLTKLKTVLAVLFLVGILSTGAVGFVYHLQAEEQPNQKQEPNLAAEAPEKDLPQKSRKELEKEIRQAKGELERLRLEQQALKKQLERVEAALERLRKPKGADTKLIQKIYPVSALVNQAMENEEASLIRIITRTIEPDSWDTSGGRLSGPGGGRPGGGLMPGGPLEPVRADSGGRGVIEYYPEGRSLIINQTAEIHERIQTLLKGLEKVKADEEKKQGGGAAGV